MDGELELLELLDVETDAVVQCCCCWVCGLELL